MNVVDQFTASSGSVIRRFECPICEDVFQGRGIKTHWSSQHDEVIPRPWWPPVHKAKRQGPRYTWAKRQVMERDGCKCQRCGVRNDELEYSLQAHHIIPFREFDIPGRAHALQNLIALCQACHSAVEGLQPEELDAVLRLNELEDKGEVTSKKIGKALYWETNK